MQYGASTYLANCLTFTNSTRYLLEWSISQFKVNGVVTNNSGKTALGTATRAMYLFYQNNDAHGYFRGGIDQCKVGGDTPAWFVPIKRNDVMQLIDLVSGNLATRVGTFTELIESPS